MKENILRYVDGDIQIEINVGKTEHIFIRVGGSRVEFESVKELSDLLTRCSEFLVEAETFVTEEKTKRGRD